MQQTCEVVAYARSYLLIIFATMVRLLFVIIKDFVTIKSFHRSENTKGSQKELPSESIVFIYNILLTTLIYIIASLKK